jgi:hypothetical protein
LPRVNSISLKRSRVLIEKSAAETATIQMP